uniref:Transmembrane protein 71-like n=1 Tax=Paramormyrops kingsleyae TaxID=1676925 RepID=A0A3B3TEV4_9TELE|nr:transmembrane protein 71-like isoform X1 [Paramormyrops kingsleyae]
MLTVQSCQNLSPLSPGGCEDHLSVSSLAESPSSSRRSTRLLTNGYYVLSDDSILSEDEGNISPSASQANISYKENMVRVFNRRKRRSFKSLASVFHMSQSHESLLEGKVPDRMPQSTLTHTTWMKGTEEGDGDLIRDHGAIPTHPEKTTPQTHQMGGLHDLPLDNEACFSKEQFSHSLGGILDIAAQSPFTATKLRQMKLLTGSKTQKVLFFIIILLVCLLTAVFSWWILGGLLLACVTFTLILASYLLTNTTLRTTRLHETAALINEDAWTSGHTQWDTLSKTLKDNSFMDHWLQD